MKKLVCMLLSVLMLMQFEIPTFAEAIEKKEVLDAAKAIQQADEKEQQEKKKVSEVIDEVNQSVVAIIGNNTQYRDQGDTYSKYPKNLQHGSGVVVEKDGKILTNNHVIDGIDTIYVVTFDGNVYKAKLLYADKEIDLALIQIDRKDLKPITLANEKQVKVGDDVVAIGTPLFFGFRNSASKGIISGLNRPVDGTYTYLQTDAAVNPGNSGGPLVNMKCELVGINTLGYSYYQGMNFSIPADNIKYFLDHYKKYGKIKRCYTGIEFEENWAALLGLPTNQGIKVVTIQKGAAISPNDVKEGDLLESIDGKPTTSIAEYNEILKNHLPGDKVKFSFLRGKNIYEIQVTLKEQPSKTSKAGGN